MPKYGTKKYRGILTAEQEKEIVSRIPAIASAVKTAEGDPTRFGVRSEPVKSVASANKILNNSIYNNYVRWVKASKPGKFIDFMQKRWAPIGAKNDPKNLNKNWAKNVRYALKKQLGEKYKEWEKLNLVFLNPFSVKEAYAAEPRDLLSEKLGREPRDLFAETENTPTSSGQKKDRVIFLKDENKTIGFPEDMPSGDIENTLFRRGVGLLKKTTKEIGKLDFGQKIAKAYWSFNKKMIEEMPPSQRKGVYGTEDVEKILQEEKKRGEKASAFGFGAFRDLSFGLLPKSEWEENVVQKHPIFNRIGNAAGQIGSFVITGSALAPITGAKAIKLSLASKKYLPNAYRFIPSMITRGATFGTVRGINEAVKQAQAGEFKPVELGKEISKAVGFGAGWGAAGEMATFPRRVLAATGVGFVGSKIEGGSNIDALLGGVIVGVVEAVTGAKTSLRLKKQAIDQLEKTLGKAYSCRTGKTQIEGEKLASRWLSSEAYKAGGWGKIFKQPTNKFLRFVEGSMYRLEKAIKAGKFKGRPAEAEKPAQIPVQEGAKTKAAAVVPEVEKNFFKRYGDYQRHLQALVTPQGKVLWDKPMSGPGAVRKRPEGHISILEREKMRPVGWEYDQNLRFTYVAPLGENAGYVQIEGGTANEILQNKEWIKLMPKMAEDLISKGVSPKTIVTVKKNALKPFEKGTNQIGNLTLEKLLNAKPSDIQKPAAPVAKPAESMTGQDFLRERWAETAGKGIQPEIPKKAEIKAKTEGAPVVLAKKVFKTGETFFHGTTKAGAKKISKVGLAPAKGKFAEAKGISVSSNFDVAKGFAEADVKGEIWKDGRWQMPDYKEPGEVFAITIKPEAKVMQANEFLELKKNLGTGEALEKELDKQGVDVIDMRSRTDGVRKRLEAEVIIRNKDMIESISKVPGRDISKKARRVKLEKIVSPEVQKLRRTAHAWAASRGLTKKQFSNVVKKITSHRDLMHKDITEQQLKDIITAVKKARPSRIGYKRVITLKTENKIAKLKEGLKKRGELTDKDFERMKQDLGLKAEGYIAGHKFITETEGKELIKRMLDEVPVIKARETTKKALEKNPKIKAEVDKINRYYKRERAKSPLKKARINPLLDMRYYTQNMESQTGQPFGDVWRRLNDKRLSLNKKINDYMDKLEKSGGENFGRIAANKQAVQRINDYVASQLPEYVTGKPKKPLNITPAEKAIAKEISSTLKSFETMVRYNRFYDWRDYKIPIPNAPQSELTKATDILESKGDEALKKWLAGRSWGIIRSGYDIGEVIKPKISLSQYGATTMSKGHLKTRQGVVFQSYDRDILKRYAKYIRQMIYLTELRPEMNGFMALFNANFNLFADPVKVAGALSRNLREIKGQKDIPNELSNWVSIFYSQAMKAVFLDPRKWLRNLHQNLAFYTSPEDLKLALKTPLTENELKYFYTYVSQLKGIKRDYLFEEFGGLPGFKTLNKFADKISKYPWTDEVNRLLCFKLKISRVKQALKEYPDDLTKMMKAAGFGDIEPLQRKYALEILARDGKETMAGYVAREVTNNIHFMYERAQRSPAEQGSDVARLLSNILTFRKGYVQNIIKNLNKLRPARKELEVDIGARRRAFRSIAPVTGYRTIDRAALRQIHSALDKRYKAKGMDYYKIERNAIEMFQHAVFGTEKEDKRYKNKNKRYKYKD